MIRIHLANLLIFQNLGLIWVGKSCPPPPPFPYPERWPRRAGQLTTLSGASTITCECCARLKENPTGPHPKFLPSHLRLFLAKLRPMEAPSPHPTRQITNWRLLCMKNWRQFISTILSDPMRSMESWPHRISCGIGRPSPTFLASTEFNLYIL